MVLVFFDAVYMYEYNHTSFTSFISEDQLSDHFLSSQVVNSRIVEHMLIIIYTRISLQPVAMVS